ncbi:hypothetical protein E2562_004619, partial [Oryza meyeriana var. granulata]
WPELEDGGTVAERDVSGRQGGLCCHYMRKMSSPLLDPHQIFHRNDMSSFARTMLHRVGVIAVAGEHISTASIFSDRALHCSSPGIVAAVYTGARSPSPVRRPSIVAIFLCRTASLSRCRRLPTFPGLTACQQCAVAGIGLPPRVDMRGPTGHSSLCHH